MRARYSGVSFLFTQSQPAYFVKERKITLDPKNNSFCKSLKLFSIKLDLIANSVILFYLTGFKAIYRKDKLNYYFLLE